MLVVEHLSSSRLLYVVAIYVLSAPDISAAVTGLASSLQEQQLLSLSSSSRQLFDCTARYFSLILVSFFFSFVFCDESPLLSTLAVMAECVQEFCQSLRYISSRGFSSRLVFAPVIFGLVAF